MIFDTYDITFLKLCGLCRYMPLWLGQKYDVPTLQRSVADNLKAHKLIKTLSDKRCVKLNRMGKKTLADIGCSFAEDARNRTAGNAFKRRLISAELTIMLYRAGIDVFADTLAGMAGNQYISSLTIRAGSKNSPLAGTLFLGVLILGSTAFIPYYVENQSSGIYPGYESGIFTNQATNVKGIKNITLLYCGETLGILWGALFENETEYKLPRGLVSFCSALREWGNDVCLIPMGRDGVTQIQVMAARDYKRRIISYVGGISDMPEEIPFCDGVKEYEGEAMPIIVAVDMNIKRIMSALNYSADIGRRAFIICFKFQEKYLSEAAAGVGKARLRILWKKEITEIFPELCAEDVKAPYITEKGEYVTVNEIT